MKNTKGIAVLSAIMAGALFLTMAAPGNTDAGNAVSVDSAKAGIMIPLNNYFASSMNPEDEIKNFLESSALEEESSEGATEESPEESTQAPTKAPKPSPYENIAISQVRNYVNIRAEANTTSEILGKIYDNSAATILDTVDGEDGKWYHIKSGSVTGYMKAEYFVTGTEAEKIAKEVGTVWGKTTATTLRLREEPSTDSRTLSLLAMGEEYIVEEEGIVNDKGEEFVKINLGEGDDGNAFIGYVASKYVDIRVEFEEAISIEEERAAIEEQERLKKEAEEAKKRLEEEKKRREEEEAKKTSTAATTKPSNTTSATTKPSTSTGDTTLLRNAIVAYAKQFVGGKYVWGGNDLNTGVDCSGFVQQVYKNFGISIPRTSRSQAASSKGTPISQSELQPGDLAFYAGSDGVVNHVVMYIGDGQVVHAASSRLGIIISPLNYRSACKYMRFIK